MCQETSQVHEGMHAQFASCCCNPVYLSSKKRIEHLEKMLACLKEKEKDVIEALEELKVK
jgi:hypothetical protein